MTSSNGIGALKWKQAVINLKDKSIVQREGIQSGEYRIGRFNKGEKYGAWFERISLGYFSSAEQAKQACLSHLQGMQVVNRNNDPA